MGEVIETAASRWSLVTGTPADRCRSGRLPCRRNNSPLRQQSSRTAVLVALHSFTPVFMGVARPWHVAVLYNRDPRFGIRLMAVLNAEKEFTVGNNVPYTVNDATDYTIPVHAERRGLHHVLIEIRQDLIAGENGQRGWGALLTRLLPQAYQKLVAAEALRSP